MSQHCAPNDRVLHEVVNDFIEDLRSDVVQCIATIRLVAIDD